MIKVLFLQNTIMHYRKPLYNALSKYYDVTVLHSGEKSVTENDKYKEIIVKNIKVGKFSFQTNLLTKIKNENYDVIIAMFDIAWINNILSLFLKNKKTKFIWWGHGYGRNNIGNFFRSLLVKKANKLILYSDRDLNKFLANGINKEKIYIAHNTILVLNHEFNENIKRNSFLFVGRLQKRKKIDLLIKSFVSIKNKISDEITIDIIGEGEEKKYLQELVKKLNLQDRVIFHGSILNENILKKYFYKALAYVSPGHVGLGVLHSLAYGVPVVTCKNEHHAPEFDNLNENNSIVYNTHNELSEILLKLSNDSKLSYKLGKSGYELYSKHRTMYKMVNIFKKAIEG